MQLKYVPMMNCDQKIAFIQPQQSASDQPLSPSKSARLDEVKLLKSLVSDYAHKPVDSVIVGQYVERLERLLERLMSRGFDASNLRTRLVAALQDKKNGGFFHLACELAAADHFLTSYPDGFCYQVPSNAPRAGEGMSKSLDFSFETQGITFNVEVKAFAPNSDISERPSVKSFLPPQETKALHNQGASISRNCAPAIGRFLMDANNQLTRPARGISVLLLCCNDLDEQSDALTCFVGPHGICSQTKMQGIVPAPADLTNIDAVVICHLGLLQSGVLYPERFSAALGGNSAYLSDGSKAWDYTLSFPIAFPFQVDRVPHDMVEPFRESFQSINTRVFKYMQTNGSDAQGALFSVFNESSKPHLLQ